MRTFINLKYNLKCVEILDQEDLINIFKWFFVIFILLSFLMLGIGDVLLGMFSVPYVKNEYCDVCGQAATYILYKEGNEAIGEYCYLHAVIRYIAGMSIAYKETLTAPVEVSIIPQIIILVTPCIGTVLVTIYYKDKREKKITSVYVQQMRRSDQEERKRKIIEQQFSESLPIVYFKIPSVICSLYPWRIHSTKQDMLGDLYFTEKGIVFVQLIDLIDEFSRARERLALAKARRVSTEVENLLQVLENAFDVLFIPRAIISKIRYTWAYGFQVYTSKGWQQFLFEEGNKTYRNYQSQIEKYLGI
jgi:hypothetical protein